MLDSTMNASMKDEREWYRDVVCSVYGVTKEFVAVETPGRLGGANEIQIHVQNRTTEANQDQFAEQVNRDLIPLFGITDWYWDFVPVEPDDERLEAEIQLIRMQAAATAVTAGLNVEVDGSDVNITGEGSRPEVAGVAMGLDGKVSPIKSKDAERPKDPVYGAPTTREEFNEALMNAYTAAVSRALSSVKRGAKKEDVHNALMRELAALELKLQREARGYLEELYLRGLSQAARDMGTKLEKADDDETVRVTFDAVDLDALDYLMAEWTGVSSTLPDFVQTQKDEFSRIIEEAYRDPGKFSLRELKRRMQEITTAEAYKLERIARTETAHISNMGRLNGYRKDPDNAKAKYNLSMSPRTACKRCRQIAAKGPYTYEQLMRVTNNLKIHPNCNCTITLHVEGA